MTKNRLLSARLDLLEPTTLETRRTVALDLAAIDPTGRLVLTASANSVTLAPLTEGEPVELSLPEERTPDPCAISADGARVAVGQGPRIHLLDPHR